MKKLLLALSFIFALAGHAEATQQSTINTTIPVQGSPITSAPVRNNFIAAYNDINNLYTLVGSGGGGGGSGTVTSVATTSPVTGGTFTTSGTIACPTCATTTSGGALSATLPMSISSSGVISIATASSSVLGAVKGDGSTLTISGAGVISCTTGTTSQLGCLSPDGSTITISNGVISAAGGGGSTIVIGTSTAHANPELTGDATSGLYSTLAKTVEITLGGSNFVTIGTQSFLTAQPLSVGTSAVGSEFNVNGGVSIGTTYVSTAAPTNGAIIQGNVGIGTSNPGALFTVGANTFEVNSSGTVLAGTWNGAVIGASFLPGASSGAKGIVQGDGSTLTISGSNVISCTTATSSQIGCSKPDGTILTITTGTETVATATSLAKGVVQGDGSTLGISSGVISCTTATASQIGCARPDNSSITISAGVLTATSSSEPNSAKMAVTQVTLAAFGGL